MSGPLWRQLAVRLEDEIRSGRRAPGSQLPSFVELASAGHSQATVMRAYGHLKDLGLLVSVPGAGSYVADTIPEQEQPLNKIVANHEARIVELESLVKKLIKKSATSTD